MRWQTVGRWVLVAGVPLVIAGGLVRTARHQGVEMSDLPLSLPGIRSARVPETAARAAVVIDADTEEVLAEHGAFTPHPIASLAKLMSAMVVLDRHPDLDALVSILPTEYTISGSNLRLRGDEEIRLRDLLVASITGSANNAAFALPRVLGLSDTEFAEAMNRTAIALGLETLHFVDAAGFSPENIGSAYEVARLAKHALASYPLIAEAARARTYRFTVYRTGAARTPSEGHDYDIRNSNPLLALLPPETESKTGYLHEAQYCLVLTRMVGGRRLIAVLLGHPLEHGVVREAEALLDDAEARVTSGRASRPAE